MGISPTSQKEKTYDKGLWAEDIAATYLKMKGYKILERRYKTPYGEIDLIARKKDIIAFVEVKARKTLDQALESITPKMRERISQAAGLYTQTVTEDVGFRFDVMAVYPPLTLHHLDNAWEVST